jgi:hypothetical protein
MDKPKPVKCIVRDADGNFVAYNPVQGYHFIPQPLGSFIFTEQRADEFIRNNNLRNATVVPLENPRTTHWSREQWLAVHN